MRDGRSGLRFGCPPHHGPGRSSGSQPVPPRWTVRSASRGPEGASPPQTGLFLAQCRLLGPGLGSRQSTANDPEGGLRPRPDRPLIWGSARILMGDRPGLTVRPARPHHGKVAHARWSVVIFIQHLTASRRRSGRSQGQWPGCVEGCRPVTHHPAAAHRRRTGPQQAARGGS